MGIAIIVILIAGFGALFYFLKSREGVKDDKSSDPAILMMQNQLQTQLTEMRETLRSHLTESTRSMQQQSGESHKLVSQFIKEVTEMTDRVARVEETGKQMVGFVDQLQNLQDILKNPKQRGTIVGEYYLETILKNVLPPGSYEMQYQFADHVIVDAIVRVKDKIIPIDSKFSLENYERMSKEKNEEVRGQLEKVFVNDLKNRIVETAKYIRPTEGTLDFAFMFIPHEAIYYDLLINRVGVSEEENLIQRAQSKYHVIIVSPTSFLAYLQTVLQGLRALQIEESAKEIRKRVEELGKHLGEFDRYHTNLGNHLQTVVNAYDNSRKEFKKIDKDVLRITEKAVGIEAVPLIGPEKDGD